MSIGNLPTQGDKKNNFTYQKAVLELLGQISASTGSGTDYELITYNYSANKNGVGYTTGDFITRTQIVSVPTGAIVLTIWFNQTTGLTIAAPPIADLDPVISSTAVTVTNLPATLGQKPMANSLAVTIANDQSSIPVTNTNLDVLLSTRATEATLATMLTLAGFEARINTLGQKTMAASTPVVLASDQSSIPVTLPTAPATSTNTSVGRVTTAGGVVILAANASRKGATISNDSGAILYLKFDVIGGTSSSSFTVRLSANAYYEVPFQYTGAISGIWASAGAGNALISELT